MASENGRRRVVITGMGAVTTLGNDAETFWSELTAGKGGAGPISSFDPSEFAVHFACELKDFEPTQWIEHRKARLQRDRWFVPGDLTAAREIRAGLPDDAEASPERRLLARERRARMAAAIDRLDGRQRLVFMLCHYGDCTPREVSAMTGLNESTVRVHLFRAARKLRGILGGKP